MKVLLTGSRGFIGTQIAAGLERQQFDFVGIDKEDSIPEDKFDVILHFGARTLIRNSLKAPYEYFQDNLDLTLRILEKCRRDSSKIIFPTSGSVQEASNPYSLSKKQGEEWVKLYSRLFSVEIYVLKLFNIYGETSRKGAVYLFSNAALKHEEITLYGDGNHIRDFVCVDDLVNFVLSIAKNEIPPGSFEVGTGKGTSINQLIRIVERAVGYKLKIVKRDYVLTEAAELFAKDPVLKNPISIEEGVALVLDSLTRQL